MFAFFMVIIIINVRKTKESQVSVLLKIMANYLQLITTSMSFASNFPSMLIEMLVPARRLGNSSETFLSFDCFITDYEIKGPFPSNVFLKIFLAAFLPIVLLLLVTVIWLIVHYTIRKWAPNLTRSIIISFISILFLLHPKLTELSLSIFRCIEIDEGISKVRIDASIDCYSSEHFKWIMALSVPIFIFWVVMPPLIAFVLLYKNIKKQEDNKVKAYLLILYQGLKEKTFYWEFFNTVRKVALLFVLLLSDSMKILFSLTLLLISARIQIYLQPYKDPENNKIELLAIVSGLVTLMSALIFVQEESVSILNIIVLIMVIILNVKFILEWIYKMLQTKADKSRFMKAVSQYLTLTMLLTTHRCL